MMAIPPARPARKSAARCVEARRIDGAVRHRAAWAAEFTYAVLPGREVPPNAASRERRAASRQRTRLRSGKLIGTDGTFIIECLIHNRSATGCRLRLPSCFTPPLDVYVYEDQSGDLFHAAVIWRKERDLGLRLSACAPTPAHRALAGRMRRKFYALGR